MGRKKKSESTEGKLEKISNNDSSFKRYNVSEGFYYILGFVLSLVLIFATDELLSTINYLFVVVFSIIAIIKIINFIIDREYLKKNYSNMIVGIMCLWLSLFTFKYGQALFLELFPVIISLLLFLMAISSIIKYFDKGVNTNLIIGVVSIIFGVTLIFVSKSMMYIFFKIIGIYIFIMVILDFIDYKKSNNKEVQLFISSQIYGFERCKGARNVSLTNFLGIVFILILC